MARACEGVYRHQHSPTPFAFSPVESRPYILLSSPSRTSSCPSGMPWRPLAVEGRGLDEESWAEETREESCGKGGEWQAELDSSSARVCEADVAVVLVEMVVCHSSNLLAATHLPSSAAPPSQVCCLMPPIDEAPCGWPNCRWSVIATRQVKERAMPAASKGHLTWGKQPCASSRGKREGPTLATHFHHSRSHPTPERCALARVQSDGSD